MRLAYIILAHSCPINVANFAKQLTTNGSYVVIHYDQKSPDSEFESLEKEFLDSKRIFLTKRISVKWGDWSIVNATLNLLEFLEGLKVEFDYVQLLSGSDLPIRPEKEFIKFLSRDPVKEYIEAVNITEGSWVSGGLEHDRYRYRHYFNFKSNKKLFDLSFKIQKKLMLKRVFPSNLKVHMGSQWWTLTWGTCKKVLEKSKDATLIKFFKTVWIPDEMYFQTLVANVVPRENISSKIITYYKFNQSGVPVIFYNDHFDYLIRQPFFFARKISDRANELRKNLELHYKGASSNLLDDYGTHNQEYEKIISSNLSFHGRRIIGITNNEWFSNLEWNTKKYLVILGRDIKTLRNIQITINKTPNFVCHGELFSKDEIKFVDRKKKYAGIFSHDIFLRDFSRPNLISQLINASNNKIMGFIYVIDKYDLEELNVFRWDKNAVFIYVPESHENLVSSGLHRSLGNLGMAHDDIKVKLKEKNILDWIREGDCDFYMANDL